MSRVNVKAHTVGDVHTCICAATVAGCEPARFEADGDLCPS